MTGHRRGTWALVTTSVALAAATLILTVVSWGDPIAENYYWRSLTVVNVAVWLTFALTGTLILHRRPGHGVGRILAAIGVGMLAIGWGLEYALRGVLLVPGSLPLLDGVAIIANVLWIVPFGLLPILLLTYPSGNFLSRRWRLAALPAVLAMGAVLATAIPQWWYAWPPEGVFLDEEVSPTVAGQDVVFAMVMGGLVLLFIALMAGVVCLAVRWRRSARVERLQIKWLLAASGLWVVGFGGFALATWTGSAMIEASVATELANLAGLAAIPVAIGVAVLRYRLYEIDRIVSRTVTYGLVTAVLVGVYMAVAVVPAAVFDIESDLLVAGATLVAAAAFRPVRRWVQARVDHRFNRARYDADRIADRFAERLREEVDLEELTADLGGVVASTMQPTHLSMWLREAKP